QRRERALATSAPDVARKPAACGFALVTTTLVEPCSHSYFPVLMISHKSASFMYRSLGCFFRSTDRKSSKWRRVLLRKSLSDEWKLMEWMEMIAGIPRMKHSSATRKHFSTENECSVAGSKLITRETFTRP